MRCLAVLSFSVLLARPLSGQQSGTAPASQPTPATVPASLVDPSPTPTPSLVDNIIKLWKANLSEDFLRKYISGADLVKDLTAEDIIKLRNAGLPENLIFLVTDRKQALASVPAPGTSPAPAAAPTATPTAAPTATPAPVATGRWEGLARRNSGIVLIKSRWDPGVLEFKDETLRWTDARDASKNVLVTAKQVTEQQLTCLKKSGGNECFEWVVRTKGQEYRFRDIAWEQGDNAKVTELFRYFKSLYPGLVSSQAPVDER
jgi:hypothetical protein